MSRTYSTVIIIKTYDWIRAITVSKQINIINRNSTNKLVLIENTEILKIKLKTSIFKIVINTWINIWPATILAKSRNDKLNILIK